MRTLIDLLALLLIFGAIACALACNAACGQSVRVQAPYTDVQVSPVAPAPAPSVVIVPPPAPSGTIYIRGPLGLHEWPITVGPGERVVIRGVWVGPVRVFGFSRREVVRP